MTTKRQGPRQTQAAEPSRPEATWRVEVYRSKRPVGRQKFRLRIIAANNERMMQGEAYVNREDALATAHLIADPAGAEVIDSTT